VFGSPIPISIVAAEANPPPGRPGATAKGDRPRYPQAGPWSRALPLAVDPGVEGGRVRVVRVVAVAEKVVELERVVGPRS
jgi:hypothetical protein